MQVYPDKLDAHLQQSLAQAYLVAGDDPLLQRDAVDSIRQAAAAKGFANIERINHDKNFDWSAWLASCSEMSLFGDQRLLELRLASAAIGNEGSAALCAYLANPAPDAILLVTAPRPSGRPKWLTQFGRIGVHVPIYDIASERLPAWLHTRAQRHGLRLARDAATLLAERIEGNLMAAVQELEKLALLYGGADAGKAIDISAEQVARAVGSSARFSAFDMLDHALALQPKSASRALLQIQSEGSEPVELTGAIGHELRTLTRLLEHKKQNTLAAGIKSCGAPPKKRELYQRALQRIEQNDIERCTLLAAQADLFGKSGRRSAAFHAIEMLLLRLAGTPLHSEALVLATGARD